MMNVCHIVQRYAPLAARILMAQVFLIAGLGKLVAFGRTVSFLARHGLPFPEAVLVLVIAVEVGARRC